MKKWGPTILIVTLIVILVFIVGVRYGQRVEKTNKNVEALLSIPPTKPQPTQTPIGYESYDGKACGAQFLYPSSLKVVKESSDQAQLGTQDTVLFDMTCAASPSAVTKDRKLEIKLNPLTGKNTYFMLSEDLLPLLNTSLEFILPPKPTLAPTIAPTSAN